MAWRTWLILALATGVLASGCPGSGAPAPIPVDAATDDGADAAAPTDAAPGIPDAAFTGCEPYIGALVDCPYQWLLPAGGCPRAPCIPEPCQGDGDCPAITGAGAAARCVFGNCVWCWEDTDCGTGRSCRAGRCIARADPVCPEPPACEAPGCALVAISEVPCPVCLCAPALHDPCVSDGECLERSPSLYSRCVYGRCGMCRNDDDCDGATDLPPGLCLDPSTHPAGLYGTWLIGWPGGYNHYSLFRFEPDGTLRRGRLPEAPGWADDIPPFPCDPGATGSWPVLGTWEAVGGGALRIRMTSGVPCDDKAWSGEFRVLVTGDGEAATFIPTGTDAQTLDAMRLSVDICDPSFTTCALPETW